MTDDAKKKTAADRAAPSPRPAPDTSVATGFIRDRLRETEKVIRGLRAELDYYRAQSTEAAKERADLLELVSTRERQRQEQAQIQGDIKLIVSERDRLAEAVAPLKRENKELKDRCARLESELAEERARHVETQEVVVYLEAQIEQLEEMVKMLSEHDRFMKTKDR